jgi:hypothetical protein
LSDAHQSVIHYDFVQRVVVQDSSEYDSVRQPLNGALYGDEQGNLSTVTDPEIRRLEDRINSVDREGQLRLEKAMAEVNGTMKVILERTDGMKSSIDALGSLKTTIIVTAVASVIAMAGCVLAGESLWGSGFSSGQSDRQSAASAPPQHYK